MNSPKLIILTAAVGSGHVRAAQAVKMAVERLNPNLHIDIIDVLDHTPRWFRTVYAGGYEFLVTRWPTMFGWLYRLTNRPARWFDRPFRAVHMRIEAWGLRRIMRHIHDQAVTHVLHTHYLPLPHMTHYRWRRFPQLHHAVVITDFEAHAYWHAENVDHFFVAADCVKDDLIDMGVSLNQIIISGIPVDPVWHETVDQESVRQNLGISADRRAVLIVAGSNFTLGPFAQIANRLAADLPDIHFIVVAGRNNRLKHQLDQIAAAHANVAVIGYTEKLHEFMAVAELLISKPGGLIASEALATGTPIVIPAAIPGQETANADFLEDHGAGQIAKTTNDTVAIVAKLMNDQESLEKMQASARSLGKNGADAVAQFVCEWIR